MNIREQYGIIIDFIGQVNFTINEESNLLLNSSKEEIIGFLKKLNIEGDDFHLLFSKANEEGFQYKLVDGNTLSKFKIYPSTSLFHKNIASYRKTDKFIVYSEAEKSFYGYVNQETFRNKEQREDIYLFCNIFSYKNFIKKLVQIGESSNKTNESFRLIDYYNSQNQTFLISSLDKRALLIKCMEFRFISSNLFENLKLFQESLEKDSKGQFSFFLKKEILEESYRWPSETGLREIFFQFEKIYEKALLNFQVYLNGISIDKLKGEREYLQSFSEIVSQILLKILAIPIAFAGSVFALSKINSGYLVIVLLIGLLASSIIINISLYNHLIDLKAISNLLVEKTKKIREHTFFNQNPSEKEEIKEILKHINSKISLVLNYVWSYFIFSSVFLCCIFLYPVRTAILTISFDKYFDFKFLNPTSITSILLIIIYIIHAVFILSSNLWPMTNEIKSLKEKINLK